MNRDPCTREGRTTPLGRSSASRARRSCAAHPLYRPRLAS
ncbi:hypothetical protein WQQ_14270 [Hydrocarboniphaga effusa AP103]|uniref:Uncharacterized protein n=1 Tax=Hydrocarboniphaga effusa AP103 TaxID=1172194 RepID=I8TBN3_9GAMM|nr:hypothetical protein WQQ_14270 [Hydrocarboniphaga effusa AP103]